MAHPKLWGTTDTRNGLPTTTKESPDFSHGECQPVSQEYGFFAKNGRHIPGYRFISDSLTDNVSKIEKTIVTEMKKKIDAEIAKGGLK
jgi:hypothetical protein